ncbi:beta-glucosidase family protein [Niveispirillum irakense]|uniref:beta-glucosidase family protein n=1 Tax=Niveispirillum irakense TaxID=34011 RepID=UPI0004261BD0|nr:beta-glucosidase [Niveispirillum irakense]
MQTRKMRLLLSCLLLTTAAMTVPAATSSAATMNSQTNAQPWGDRQLSPDQRAELLLRAMTVEEKKLLVFGYFGSPMKDKGYFPPEEARMGSAGYVPGIARLGIPPQWLTDAGVGVATQRDSLAPYRERTSLPAGIATAATWNPALAEKGGAMIGKEARASGFNVMLAGGINLVREPRNGRNFEYGGEDPLLAGIMVGAQIKGIQSNNIISTIKHFALNAQETGRFVLNAKIDEAGARMSDLLAFEIAMEKGEPASVMCAYNRYNGPYACESDFLLNRVLKQDWGYKGYVMSDWGAVHSTAPAANAGLDQQSGYIFDKKQFFGAELLGAALKDGSIPMERLDDMNRRILHALFATGAMDNPVEIAPIDMGAHAIITQADAEEGIVLLKNEGNLLPLAASAKRIAVIGGYADKGVLSGGGSSTVFGPGGNPVPGLGPQHFPGPVVFHASAPLNAIAKRAGKDQVRFDPGTDPAAAAALAAESDLVILFANQWTGEAMDFSLTLPDGQEGLIQAVAKANKNVVVVLQTGGPVLMPWLDQVPAVLEAWYPGTRGGEAIARVLYGEIDASGRLPVTFPQSLDQLPRPVLDGTDKKQDEPFDVTYQEGAAVGYKWFDREGHKPLFPFGHGLSYTTFEYGDLKASATPDGLRISARVTNTGSRHGQAVPQLYVGPAASGWEAPKRLAGFQKLALAPGESKQVEVTVDPRLLATYDVAGRAWNIAAGDYQVHLARSATDIVSSVPVTLAASRLSAVKGQQ